MIETNGKETFTKIELEAMVRVVRQARDMIVDQKLMLQERELMHGDGHVREAILHCENHVFVLTSCISKLWLLLYPPSRRP